MEYADYAQFLGSELVMVKSPINGVLIFKVLRKDEFLPVKTVRFQQNILDNVSNFSMVNQYLLAGGSQGEVHVQEMRATGNPAKTHGVMKEGTAMHMVEGCIAHDEMVVAGVNRASAFVGLQCIKL